MADRAVGVDDKAAANPVIAEYRTRERTVGGLTNVDEQYLIYERERVEQSLTAYSQRSAVLAAADGATAWRWMLRNPTGSGVMVGLRTLAVSPVIASNALVVASAPRFTLERWSATGTPAGGTAVTPARILSGQTPTAVLYSAAPTGLTLAAVATVFSFFPATLLTATTTEALQPQMQTYVTRDQGVELAPGEALTFRQADAGTATEATHRFMLASLLVEEFTKP